MAESLGNYLWGEAAKVPVPVTQSVAEFTEQFETLYQRANAEEKETFLAMSVYMTSCSKCQNLGNSR